MKNIILNKIKHKIYIDNFKKQINDDYEIYRYNALYMDRLTNADSQNLEHTLGTIIYHSTSCIGSSLYDISDKLSWLKISNITTVYRDILAPVGTKINTSYKAAVLMALIILSDGITDDYDNQIRLALDSALYYMCNYSVEYNGTIPVVQSRVRYDYDIPDIEEVLKYIKVYNKNTIDNFRESGKFAKYGRYVIPEITKALAKEFEPLLIYIYKSIVLHEENEKVISNIHKGVKEYDEKFKEEPEEIEEAKIPNKGISRILKRRNKKDK